MKTRILIVDDEVDALDLMEELFQKNGYETYTARNGVQALKIIREQEPDIVISDIVMPEMDGMKLLEAVSKEYPDISMIMITAHGTIETAVEAMKKGAKDYILKPLRLDEILTKVKNNAELKALMRENQYLREKLSEKYGLGNIVGKNKKMQELFNLIQDVARTSSTVLIRGESGTGKELIANAIHFNSDRVNKPFIKINCGVLAENLLESELFGHEKGAFTGAIKSKPGRFELADGGTIFLDEIGDISPNMQLKLLRVLQEGEFERVGGTETKKVDVRIIAATNRNLEEAMKEGAFRQDLYYRLNVIPIEVPPLRERKDDIPLLIEHFLNKFNQAFNKNIQGVDEEAMRCLQTYHWPGNIRELENLLERAVVLNKTGLLTVKDFPPYVVNAEPENSIPVNLDRPLTELVDEYEKQIILVALRENNFNKLRTAEKLGIHRSTFMSKLKKYGIN
ncbi:MAG: sigma-54-dependent Fis family transcriptional regulator [Calditrichaeota bacterium]|nr:MAG: sigma-54-dependent Fis family transcriptional regulator [Calditrichota bacterium]